MKKLTKFVFILSSVILTSADLKCEIKNGVDQAMHKISDQAAKGLHFSGGRTKGYMRVLQCRCKDDDVSKIRKSEYENTYFEILYA